MPVRVRDGSSPSAAFTFRREFAARKPSVPGVVPVSEKAAPVPQQQKQPSQATPGKPIVAPTKAVPPPVCTPGSFVIRPDMPKDEL